MNIIEDKAKVYVDWMKKCIFRAINYKSRLDPFCLSIDGMSSYGTRHLLNNVLSYEKPLRYLEIGSWKGSTFCSAICNNDVEAVSIDNFSEFTKMSLNGDSGNAKDCFHKNLKTVLALSVPKPRVTCLEKDAFSVDVSLLGKFDVYFYDGEHSYDSQYKAFTYFDSCLNDVCIIFVDDYNVNPEKNMDVANATEKAFNDLGYKIKHDWVLVTRDSDDIGQARDQWWNNVYIAIIEKEKHHD